LIPFSSQSRSSVVVAAVAIHVGLIGVYLGKCGGDLSALVGASHAAVGHPPLERVSASIGPGGYDGMFYYAIARNPWVPHTLGIDAPAFRHVRVLYPMLCWLLSGGDADLLLWVMPAVNLLAIAALAWLGATLALKHGMSPWWGFVLPLAVNACIPALRNLTDNVSTLAVFALLLAWLLDARWWVAALLALAALFAREQNVLVVGILILAATFRKQPRAVGGLAGVLAVWFVWLGLLHAAYGCWPFQIGVKVFGVPFAGMAYGWSHLGGSYHFSTRLAIVNGLSLGHMALLLCCMAPIAVLCGSRIVGGVILIGALLAVVSTDVIWNDLWSYRRAFVWLPLGIWLGGIQTRRPWLLVSLLPAALFSLAAALRLV
jgi:hypothetical protein